MKAYNIIHVLSGVAFRGPLWAARCQKGPLGIFLWALVPLEVPPSIAMRNGGARSASYMFFEYEHLLPHHESVCFLRLVYE